MTDEEYMELWATVKTVSDTAVHLLGSMMVLRASVEAMAQQQRQILERLGCNPHAADLAFAKAREDALRAEFQNTDTQMRAIFEAGRKRHSEGGGA